MVKGVSMKHALGLLVSLLLFAAIVAPVFGEDEQPKAWQDQRAVVGWVAAHPESMAKVLVTVCTQQQLDTIYQKMFPPEELPTQATVVAEALEVLEAAGASADSLAAVESECAKVMAVERR